MDPDKIANIYNKGFTSGQEHALPSRKTLEKFAEMEKLMDEKLKAKVGWRVFNVILGITMGVVVGMFYLVWEGQKEIQEKVNNTNSVVASIEGKLEPFDFILE